MWPMILLMSRYGRSFQFCGPATEKARLTATIPTLDSLCW